MAKTYTLRTPITRPYIQGGGNEMRPRFPDLPRQPRIVEEEPTEVGKLTNDISFGCQQGKLALASLLNQGPESNPT
jgi:hypothetical protein